MFCEKFLSFYTLLWLRLVYILKKEQGVETKVSPISCLLKKSVTLLSQKRVAFLGLEFYILYYSIQNSFTLVIFAITFNYVYWQCENKCVIKILDTSLSAELRQLQIKWEEKRKEKIPLSVITFHFLRQTGWKCVKRSNVTENRRLKSVTNKIAQFLSYSSIFNVTPSKICVSALDHRLWNPVLTGSYRK